MQRPICAVSGARPTPACPAVVQEYLFPEELAAYEQERDRFFPTVQGDTQFKLPAEYNEWLARQPKSATDSMAMGLRVFSPRSGDVFVIGKDDASQRL